MKTLRDLNLDYDTVTALLENKVRIKKEQMLKYHSRIVDDPYTNLDSLRESVKEYEQAVDELEEHKGWKEN